MKFSIYNFQFSNKPQAKKLKFKKGFTLIELLVVISIIGILAAFVFVNLIPPQKEVRDTERKSDLEQYKTALEVYSGTRDHYPSFTSTVGVESVCSLLTLASSASGCPADPRKDNDSSFVYSYQSDGMGDGTSSATRYVLWGKLEKGGFWVVCSGGNKGVVSLNFDAAGGTCPL